MHRHDDIPRHQVGTMAPHVATRQPGVATELRSVLCLSLHGSTGSSGTSADVAGVVQKHTSAVPLTLSHSPHHPISSNAPWMRKKITNGHTVVAKMIKMLHTVKTRGMQHDLQSPKSSLMQAKASICNTNALILTIACRFSCCAHFLSCFDHGLIFETETIICWVVG
mgnify:CR=1 FL=1